jgi:hypothetical protein
MKPQLATAQRRLRLFGLLALVVITLDICCVEHVFATQVDWWLQPVCYLGAAALAALGFPSVPSIIALCLLTLRSYDEDFVLLPHFEAVLWVMILAGSVVAWRTHRGLPAALLIIGASGCVVLFTLHAFSPYTHGLVLDGFGWSHWSFTWLAAVASAAMLCFPVGLAMIFRKWQTRT